MALLFTPGTQYLVQSTAIATAAPLSFACWVNVNSTTANGTMISISSYQAGFTDMFELCIDGSLFSAQIGTGAGFGRGGPHSTVVLVQNVWYHVAAVYPSSGVATIYTNGDAKVTQS